MQVNALDHFNLITDDLEATATFYQTLLSLERRNGPPPLTPDNAQWMCDHSGRPVVHINTPAAPKAIERDTRPGPQTGAVHHIALNCTGHDEMIGRIEARGLEHHRNEITVIGLRQIFVQDPNGVLLELNFFAE